ncbi:hypothetical protein [uncultured Sphingomonas sp.]|uniref:hypothetical protein n=1 Tax=uncultured Sphingomonas sp. TaxID=158754 RepID=UPI0035CAE07C
MSRLRLTAAALAVLTLLVSGLFWMNADINAGIPAGTSAAALSLAVVLPFGANDPRGRKRVFAALVAFLVAVALSLWIALQTMAGYGAMGVLAGLLGAGMVLAVWSFRTRNRRRRSAWADYYDAAG